LGVRGGLAGGAVYLSVEEGLWGDAPASIACYEKVCDKSRALLKDVPIEVNLTTEISTGNNSEFSKLRIFCLSAPKLKFLFWQVPSIDVPKMGEMCTFVRVNWNKAVYAAFDGVAVAPRKVRQWSSDGYDAVVKMINEPPKPVPE